MKKRSFRSKLIITAFGLSMAGLLLLTAVTYWQINEVIETELIDAMASRTKESADHINTWLAGRLGEVQETAQSPLLARVLVLNPQVDLWRDDESIKLIDEINLARWKYVAAAYPNQYAALHIVNFLQPDEWGEPAAVRRLTARYYNVREGICKTDPWARTGAEEAGRRYALTGQPYDAIFKPSYSQAYGRDMVIIVAWRKDALGRVVGGAAASLNIETIQDIAHRLRQGPKGYGMLLAKDGTFVAHPNPEWAMKRTAAEVGDENVRRLGDLAAGGGAGVLRFVDGGEKKIAFYHAIPVAQWTVVSVVDENELFVPADKLRTLVFTIAAVIIAFTLMAAYIISYITHLRHSHAAERRAYLAEISALQAQIQPHFLYNTLNIVTAFCRTDPVKAAEMLDELSNYLQGKFRLNAMELVPLEQELDLIKSYLAIEKIRFGDRLNAVFDIDPDVNPLIPPLILQPLVENAVKHGVYPKRGGGSVKISVTGSGGKTRIVIADDGVGMTPGRLGSVLAGTARDAGIGIRNIHRRLQRYYGHGLEIASEVNAGTTITVIIPADRGEQID